MKHTSSDPPLPVGFDTVFAAELKSVRASRKVRTPGVEQPEPKPDVFADADQMRVIGLALSGGGIRSSTFNLGVIQGLAKHKVLGSLDYLSTVSGGGFIGSWLHAMLKRVPGGMEKVQHGLDPANAKADNQPQKALAHLRAYSNYLTPEVSLLSADTWSLWAIWSRNTMLNLTTLVAGFATAVLTALAVSLWLKSSVHSCTTCQIGAQIAAAVCFLVSAFVLGMNLLKLTNRGSAPLRRADDNGGVQKLVLAPALIGSVALTFAMLGGKLVPTVWAGVTFSVLFAIFQAVSGFYQTFDLRNTAPRPWKFAFLLLIVPIASGFATAGLLHGLVLIVEPWKMWNGASWMYLTVCPPAIIFVLTLGVVLNQGLMGRDVADEVREWLGRLGAWAAVYVLGWLLVFGAAFFGPFLMKWLWNWASYKITSAWVLATIGSLMAGKSAKTNGAGDDKSTTASALNFVAVAGPYIFMTGFVLSMSLAIHELVSTPAPSAIAGLWDRHWGEMESIVLFCSPSTWIQLGTWHSQVVPLWIMAALATWLMSWRVDINEFSLHHFYKNRLVRCYLGASRDKETRHPNPFTGFDPVDDFPLNHLNPGAAGGPFPILNATLNLSSGRNLAWQERKGASFIFTPLYCGYDGGGGVAIDTAAGAHSGTSMSRMTRAGLDKPQNAYLDSRFVAQTKEGGIRLGTAFAISGAAANPNQGFHSSTAVAFLMTVFNVRLGWWLGNPSGPKRNKSGPMLGLPYTLSELFGTSDAASDFVNLSDGGHFDNMGLYELVRRRCRYIVLCDGEQDESLAFGGLSEAIRMCRTDFDAEITIDLSGLARKPSNDFGNFSSCHSAVGKIHYPPDPHKKYGAQVGVLVYVKASLTGEEPADILGYHTCHAIFPHESTADQWFTESQFESYRRLGLEIGDKLFSNGGKEIADDPAAYFRQLEPW